MTFSAAFSPCPNDIFLFRSFLEKHEGFPSLRQIMIADIASLNFYALEARFPLIKILQACILRSQTRTMF